MHHTAATATANATAANATTHHHQMRGQKDMDDAYKIDLDTPLGVGVQGPVLKAISKSTEQLFAKKMLGTTDVSEATMKDLKNELVRRRRRRRRIFLLRPYGRPA